MHNSWLRALHIGKRRQIGFCFLRPTTYVTPTCCRKGLFNCSSNSDFDVHGESSTISSSVVSHSTFGSSLDCWIPGKVKFGKSNVKLAISIPQYLNCQCTSIAWFSCLAGSGSGSCQTQTLDSEDVEFKEDISNDVETKSSEKKPLDFSQVPKELLPTVLIVGRPNVGKSALFNRLIRRREALVYNTPDDHVTRDIREGIAKLGDLRFRVLDSAGLEAAATWVLFLGRTADMTANVLSRSHFAIFLIAARDGLQPMDLQVGKWLRKHAPGIEIVLVMNKSESLEEADGSLAAAAGEAYDLGFGDPIAISAETGLGMADLYDALSPRLESYMLQVLDGTQDNVSTDTEEAKLPLQLAIVGRPNVGKSTLLNTLLQEERVLVGPEAGLTRDSIRAQFEFDGRTVYMVDTAGWLERTKEKGPASLSIMQTRKNLMRAHVIALVLDGEEIAKERKSMKHAEVVIARQALEEGRGLVVIVNKMDLLRGKQKSKLYEDIIKAVPEELQKLIPQVTGIPVVFVSALEGRGRIAVMRQVIETYEKWCLRLSTARLNRWLRKALLERSSSTTKDQVLHAGEGATPTFVAFVKGKTELADSEIRFLTKSLKEDFDIGGIPIRILQRPLSRKDDATGKSNFSKGSHTGKVVRSVPSDKRSITT